MEGRGTAIGKVWIAEAETVTALGANLEELWQGLLAGKTGIKPVRRFEVDNYQARIAATVDDLEPSGARSMVHDLLDRLLSQMESVPADCVLIAASTKSGIDNLERMRRGLPCDCRDILLSEVTGAIHEKLALTAESMTISAACASSAIAVARGAAMIASGRVGAVMVCCYDLITEFVLSGFSALQAISPFPCKPFDRDRAGLSLGEGAAGLLLMNPERARGEGRFPLGSILGWGMANDATHITAPARDGCGLVKAIRQAIQAAGVQAEEISAISAHGTGTVHNDLMELTAFHQVFGGRQLPVYSVKGAIGHTMGAAGGIEVALGLKNMATRIVPPTVGFCNPEAGAKGLVRAEPVSMAGGYLLTTNSGFGGINAAIVLGKPAES